MIPVVNQIQSRASPVATAPARGTEAVAQVAAQPEVEVRPVEQAEATHDAAQRGRGDLDRARDAQAVAAQRQRSNQNRTVIEADSPQDRAVFRAKVIRFLQSICLGLAFGGVIWTVTGLAEGRIAMKQALDILLNRPLKEE